MQESIRLSNGVSKTVILVPLGRSMLSLLASSGLPSFSAVITFVISLNLLLPSIRDRFAGLIIVSPGRFRFSFNDTDVQIPDKSPVLDWFSLAMASTGMTVTA